MISSATACFRPKAIRAYLARAAREWAGGGPDFVLLVGDSTSDYLNKMKMGDKAPNQVPSYTRREGSSHEGGEDAYASDTGTR